MSKYVGKLPGKASVEEKLMFLQNQIELLSKRLIESEQKVYALQKVVDPEIKTRKLLELLRALNTHTSAMPDMAGYNTDHDRRYLIRGEKALFKGIYFGENGRRLWWVGVESGNLVIRFDKNLGVGAEDWTGDPTVVYYPNFD